MFGTWGRYGTLVRGYGTLVRGYGTWYGTWVRGFGVRYVGTLPGTACWRLSILMYCIRWYVGIVR